MGGGGHEGLPALSGVPVVWAQCWETCSSQLRPRSTLQVGVIKLVFLGKENGFLVSHLLKVTPLGSGRQQVSA